jgi:hypothetical protein
MWGTLFGVTAEILRRWSFKSSDKMVEKFK